MSTASLTAGIGRKRPIFIIEDDAQDGPDHVDARRTTAYVVSPYIKRQTIDSTLYTTSSMLRTMELLLGLPPMSQYDAAANPMYASFGEKPDLTPFDHIKPQVDVMDKKYRSGLRRKAIHEDGLPRCRRSSHGRAERNSLEEHQRRRLPSSCSGAPCPIRRTLTASLCSGVQLLRPEKLHQLPRMIALNTGCAAPDRVFPTRRVCPLSQPIYVDSCLGLSCQGDNRVEEIPRIESDDPRVQFFDELYRMIHAARFGH